MYRHKRALEEPWGKALLSARRLNITASKSGARASSQRPGTGGEEGNRHSVDRAGGGGGGGERGKDEHQTIPVEVAEGNVRPFLPTICLSRRGCNLFGILGRSFPSAEGNDLPFPPTISASLPSGIWVMT